MFFGVIIASYVSSQTGKLGINTTDPKATLDVNVGSLGASSGATTNEGILIPRISKVRLGNVATASLTESTLVYVNNISGTTTSTTTEVTSVGFYYYNNSLKKWIKITDKEDHDLRFVGTNNHITKDAGVLGTGTDVGTGTNNIGIGKNTLNANTTGSYNIAIGNDVLKTNTVGVNNINLGNISGEWIKGNANVHIGNAVAGTITSELDNVVAIGNGITNLNTTISNDNVILLGNNQTNAPKIGLGTYKPTEKLTVNGNIAVGILTDQVGYPQVGNYLSFEGTGQWSSMIGEFPNSDVFAFYRYEYAQDNSHLRLNIGDNDGSIDAFSIGVRDGYQRNIPIYNGFKERFRFEADGSAFKIGDYLWAVPSDKNMQEDIQPYTKGLNELKNIKPVDFRYKANIGRGNERQVGVTAQDIESVVPTMVGQTYDAATGVNGVKYVKGNEFIFMLINAVKELSNRVDKLEAEVATLKTKVP